MQILIGKIYVEHVSGWDVPQSRHRDHQPIRTGMCQPYEGL
ncbi:DNA-binding transcriptional repressor [Roseovarius sp. TM1035]|nr:DNA-binding transcriptional repressor [Roseovarius sp. TM1035]